MAILNLQNGISTRLSPDMPNANLSSFTTAFLTGRTYDVGSEWAAGMTLVKFDLSALVGKSVTLAKLRIYHAENGWCAGNIYVHRVLPTNSAWTETGATWNHAVTSVTRWAGDSGSNGGPDAGCNQPGTDFSTTPMDIATLPGGNLDLGVVLEFDLSLTEFAATIDNNCGFVLFADATNAFRLCLAAHTTEEYRPELYVEYEDVATPATGVSLTAPTILHGLVDDQSRAFSVEVYPVGSACDGDVVVTPTSTLEGTFIPATITLHDGIVNDSGTFIFIPSAFGEHHISIVNDGGLSESDEQIYTAFVTESIFEDDFSSGNLSSWTGVIAGGESTSLVIDGVADFNCPNGNNNGNPPPLEFAFAYKQISWPASDVVWAEFDFQFIGEDTAINFGGGFVFEFCSAWADQGGGHSQRWNVEIYSPNQEADDPDSISYPFKLCGTSDDGITRLHGNEHTWLAPDTWHHARIEVNYTGVNPMASAWVNDTLLEADFADISILSSAATRPTYVRIGCPWWDEAAKEHVQLDNVLLYTESEEPQSLSLEPSSIESVEAFGSPTVTLGVSSVLWSDDFERVDGAPGNGWVAVRNQATAAIDSGHLRKTDIGNWRAYGNNCGGNLPRDYSVTVTVPHLALQCYYFGIFVKGLVDIVPCVQLFRGSPAEAFGLTTAGGYQGANNIATITGGNPASWSVDQDHTITITCVGTLCTVYLDGQEWGYATIDISGQFGETGTYIGMCGDSQNNQNYYWKSVVVESIDSNEPLTIEPSAITSAEAFGVPSVQRSGEIQNVVVSSIISAEAFGLLTVQIFEPPQIVSPSSIASAEVFGTPIVERIILMMYPTSISSSVAFGWLRVTGGVSIKKRRSTSLSMKTRWRYR